MSDDISEIVRELRLSTNEYREHDAADEIERLLDIVEKVAMGSFLNDTMYDAIRDAQKYISAIPAEG